MNVNVQDLTTDVVDEHVQQLTTISAVACIGAGAIHAVAIGVHAEDPLLANIFVALAVAQLASGIALMVRPGRAPATAVVAVNAAAVIGWLTSRLVGVWFIAGLEVVEAPRFADAVAASLGGIALAGAAARLSADTRLGRARLSTPVVCTRAMVVSAIVVATLTVPAMSQATTHVHSYGTDDTDAQDHDHDDHDHDTADPDDENVDDNAARANAFAFTDQLGD